MVEHFPRDAVRQGVLLVERWVAEYGVEAERPLAAGQRVINHKLTAIQRLAGMLVLPFRRLDATAIGDSSLKTTLACGFFCASSVSTITPLAAAEIHNLPFPDFPQMFNKETCADIMLRYGRRVRTVAGWSVGTFIFSSASRNASAVPAR